MTIRYACKKQQIELDYHIGIGDEELPVTELCLILNNALENAVEASLTMPEGERRLSARISFCSVSATALRGV